MICAVCGRSMRVGRTEHQGDGRLIVRWRYCECGNSERTEERPKPKQEEKTHAVQKPF
jgi:hypothetical protein